MTDETVTCKGCGTQVAASIAQNGNYYWACAACDYYVPAKKDTGKPIFALAKLKGEVVNKAVPKRPFANVTSTPMVVSQDPIPAAQQLPMFDCQLRTLQAEIAQHHENNREQAEILGMFKLLLRAVTGSKDTDELQDAQARDAVDMPPPPAPKIPKRS